MAAIISAAAAQKYLVSVTDDWTGQSALWSLVLLPSGARTSPVVDDLLRPILAWQDRDGTSLRNTTELYELPVRGSQSPIGAGCGGTGGPPSLVAEGAVAIGNLDFELVVTNGLPMATAMVALSAVQTSLPLGPCTLYPLPLVVWMAPTTTSSTGEGRFPIPFSTAFSGANVTCQGFVMDPQGGFVGFAFTQGLQLVLGS